MKILFLTHYTTLYGANRSLLNLIKELKKFGGFSSVLLPHYGEMALELEKNNIPYFIDNFSWDFVPNTSYIGLRGIKNRLKRSFGNYLNARRIAVSLKNHEFDLIYSNSSVFNTGYFISKMLKLPHIWHIREFADLHYDLIPLPGYKVFRYLLSKSSAKIFVSQCLKDYYKLTNDTKSYAIFNGVAKEGDFLKYKDRNNRFIHPVSNTYVFCIVGVIAPNKGQIDAIKAIQILNKKHLNIKLVIAGAGDKSNLEEYIQMNEIHNIEFLGHVDDPFSVFLSSDVSLMCSKNEAMGRVTVESMCVKTPVIGRDNAGTSELIINGRTGLLYDGTIEDMALKMEMLILNNTLREKLAEEAWVWAMENCSQEKYGKSIYDILKNVMKKQNKYSTKNETESN
jgi:glycosyltransferase involved in cell wall biosynthesis